MRLLRAASAAVVLCALAGAALPGEDDPRDGAALAHEELPAAVRAILVRVDEIAALPKGGVQRMLAQSELAGAHSWTDLVQACAAAPAGACAEAALETLGRVDLQKFAEMLERAAQPGASAFLRVAALRAAAVPGTPARVAAVLGVAAAHTSEEWASPAVPGCVREALTAALDAHPDDATDLVAAWRVTDEFRRRALLDAAEAARPAVATRTMSALLDVAAPDDVVVLARIARMVPRHASPWSPGAADAVRRALESESPDRRSAAAAAAGRMRLYGSVDLLVQLLDDPVAARAARASLEALTGVQIVASRGLWAIRIRQERTTFAESWPEERRRIAEGEPDEVVAAVARAALRKLHTPEILDAIAARSDDRVPAVRRAAVDALGRLGHPDAIPSLLARADDPAPEVAAAAAAALSAVTRLSGPRNAAGWRAACGL